MNNSFKSVLIIVCLLFNLLVHSQSQHGMLNNGSKFDYHTPSKPDYSKSLNLGVSDLKTDGTSLSLFNGTKNMYDTYVREGNVFVPSGSSTIFEDKSNFFTTLFVGKNGVLENHPHLQNYPIMIDEESTFRVRDSFNPYGATNMKQALVGGLFGLLLSD